MIPNRRIKLIINGIVFVLNNNLDIEFGKQTPQFAQQGSSMMRAVLAQSQQVAEEALVMFRSNSIIGKHFIVSGKESSKWRVG
jgi:hypothetical protein